MIYLYTKVDYFPTVSLHYQCVSEGGNVSSLAMITACDMMKNPKHDTRIKCKKPSDCSQGSICCNETCKTRMGVDTCPFDTL